MSKLVLHTLPPSPHNTKVRLALKVKGLDYEAHELTGFDGREALVAATGQPLSPVLIDDGKKVYDSFGIIRYLDANWPEPRLFFDTREEMRAVETWENFVKNGVGPALGMALMAVIEGDMTSDAFATSEKLYNELAVRVEDALAGGEYLVGGRLSAADLTVAPFMAPAVVDPASQPEQSPMRGIASKVRLSGKYPRTQAWTQRIMALDGQPAPV